MSTNLKVKWSGTLTGVQLRIRLWRSFDESAHTYLGYVLRIKGEVEGVAREFIVAISKRAQDIYGFRSGDRVTGVSEPVSDARLEIAEFYKTSGLCLLEKSSNRTDEQPPWLGVVPDLEVYRQRRHRRLAARTYDAKCCDCLWACRMPVEIIIDLRHFVMVQSLVHYTPPVHREKCLDVAE